MRRGCLLLIACFLLVTSYGLPPPPPVTAAPLYDFVAGASSASWSSGAGNLPWPGSTSDARGFALYRSQVTLEDGVSRTKVLQTHPQWVDAGWIQGYYPMMTVPANSRLAVTVGFIQGATASDGVIFRVYFQQGQTRQTLVDQRSYHDGHLDTVSVDLAPYAGTSGNFILYVNALKGSGQDWAVWAGASIEQVIVAQPDLTITAMRHVGSSIYYTIANVGTAACGTPNQPASHYTALFIDGQLATQDHVTVSLNPGASVERQFAWQYAISGAQDTVRICADYQQNVQELSESNNSREETWTQNLPDLVVDQIGCETGNHITFTLKNAGTGPLPPGWRSLADVFVDGIKKGFFDLTAPTSTTGGGIAAPGGTSTYITALTFATPVVVRVVADSTMDITESSESNNTKDAKLEPCSPVGKLPDLVPTGLMLEPTQNLVRFTIRNAGEAAALPGHVAVLQQGGSVLARRKVLEPLEPGEERSWWFLDYHPTPSALAVTYRVTTDEEGVVTESNEKNNSLDRALRWSDASPPTITRGPAVVDIAPGSATVTWTTDEPSTSTVVYGRTAGMLALTAHEAALVTAHSILLANLSGGTVYEYMVQSTDRAGNAVASAQLLFETASERDTEVPSVSLALPATLAGDVTIRADTRDNKGVDRVIFLIDEKPVVTDSTPPFEVPCSLGGFADGIHSFGAQAVDAAGNVAQTAVQGTVANRRPPSDPTIAIHITSPEPGSSVYGYQLVTATVSSVYHNPITRTRVLLISHTSGTEEVLQDVSYRTLPRPIYTPEGGETYPGTYVEISCPWSTLGLLAGSRYSISVEAWDSAGNTADTSVTITKVSEPELGSGISIVRTGTRDQTHFDVQLTISNNNPDTPENRMRTVTVIESCRGFQPATSTGVAVSFAPASSSGYISAGLGAIVRGLPQTISYTVVPALFSPILSAWGCAIGDGSVLFSFEDGYGRSRLASIPCPIWSNASMVEEAWAAADYLLVTCPGLLFSTNPWDADGVNGLLATSASLAAEKLGVMGYFNPGLTAEGLRLLLKEGTSEAGLWSRRLTDNWTTSGYLLLIGEQEIVPTFTNAQLSDHWYSCLHGEDQLPDVRVGRIIGDTAADLVIPIRNSLSVARGEPGHHYDGSDELLVAGTEGLWEQFVRNNAVMATVLFPSKRVLISSPNVDWEYYSTDVQLLAEALAIIAPLRYDFNGRTPLPDPRALTLEQLIREVLEALWHTWPPAVPPGTELAHLGEARTRAQLIQNERRGGDYGEYAAGYASDALAEADRCALLKSRTAEKDIVFYAGHGDQGGWAGGFANWTGAPSNVDGLSFGTAHPIVLAASCGTGLYETGVPEADLPAGIAEAFLAHGAGVYIGCTEGSPGDVDEILGKTFFRDYYSRTGIVGDIFTAFERYLWLTGDATWQRVVETYNLYGDPKFGGR